jgi:hypothetical protein
MIGWLLMLIEENNSELARTSLATCTRETTARSKHTWRLVQVEELLPLACSPPNHTTAAAGVKLLLCSKHLMEWSMDTSPMSSAPSSNPADQLERQGSLVQTGTEHVPAAEVKSSPFLPLPGRQLGAEPQARKATRQPRVSSPLHAPWALGLTGLTGGLVVVVAAVCTAPGAPCAFLLLLVNGET